MARNKIMTEVLAEDHPQPEAPTGEKIGSYFLKPKPLTGLLTSGCKLFDLALGGGYGLSRIINIIGDSSTGKTLLAIEAIANFAREFPEGKIWYDEVESAFDTGYAEELGMPVDRVEFIDGDFTVEDFYATLLAKTESLGPDDNGLFILDSLDALSDKSELERGIGDSSYGANKAKKLSELFRRMVQKLADKNVTLIIISQVRENMNAGLFGAKFTVSGGKALQYYSTQRIMLSQMGQLKKTKKGIEKVYGVKVRAKVIKNKIGSPNEQVDYEIIFGYGIDSVKANMDWLKASKFITDEEHKNYAKKIASGTEEEYRDAARTLDSLVEEKWYEVKEAFAPTRKKYAL